MSKARQLTDSEKKQLVQAYEHAINNIKQIASASDIKTVRQYVMPDLKGTLKDLGANDNIQIRQDFERQAGLTPDQRPETLLDTARERFMPPKPRKQQTPTKKSLKKKDSLPKRPRGRPKATPKVKPAPRPRKLTLQAPDVKESIWATWLNETKKLSEIDGCVPHGPLEGMDIKQIHQTFDTGKVHGTTQQSLYDLENRLKLTELTLEKVIESLKLTWDKHGIVADKTDDTPFQEGLLKGWITPKDVHNELRAGCLERHRYRSLEDLTTTLDIGVINRDKILIAAFLTWQASNFESRPTKHDGFFQYGSEAGKKFTWDDANAFLSEHGDDQAALEQLLDQAGIINGQKPSKEKLQALGINIVESDGVHHAFPAAKEEENVQQVPDETKKRRVSSSAFPFEFKPY